MAVKDKWFSLAFDCFHLNLFVQNVFTCTWKKRENSSNVNVSCHWNFILDWFSFTDPKSIHLLKVLWSRCVANDKKVHRGHKQMQQLVYIHSWRDQLLSSHEITSDCGYFFVNQLSLPLPHHSSCSVDFSNLIPINWKGRLATFNFKVYAWLKYMH